jgi:peptidoglycan/LPS O-acetylase OafA/YrhL
MNTSPSTAAFRPTDHIPTLDGWRGIAILLVLFDHITLAMRGNFAVTHSHPRPWIELTGHHGVTLFFVLSGYLITWNLLAQPINLKRFYVRRFFRLMPTAWLYLATMLLFGWGIGQGLTSWTEIRGCLLFYRNYQGFAPGGGFELAMHFWSLSIEEQFYLVWPWVLLLLGARRCKWIAATGAVGVAVYRYAYWSRYQVNYSWAHADAYRWARTEVRADALFVGCLLALLIADGTFREQAVRVSKWLAAPAIACLLFAIYSYQWLQPLWESVAIAVLLAYTSLHPKSPLGRILDWQPLAWLGTISYSIYVWQEIFMRFPRGTALAISLVMGLPYVAVANYYLVERPLRKFGRRLTEDPARRLAIAVPEAASVALGEGG